MKNVICTEKKDGGMADCEMEVCVVCGRMTHVPKNQPISLRKTYVQAAGQLCGECFRRIYDMEDVRML